ncbi:MAG: hypothetical protein J5860_05745 [Clostridia bacterium]|nr:hypothetical protein [Clostridia bacterium]
MILDPKRLTVAYRCAGCGQTVYGMTGALTLTGDMFKLKCGCGASELTLKPLPDDKVRVSLPCVFCKNVHTFVVSKKLLSSRDLFTYPCAYAGIDVCFFGTDESVGEAVKESDAELADLLTDEEREALEEMENGDYAESDEHIRDMITLVLGDLDAEGKIYCDCGVPKDLIVENGPDYVELSCKKCGCKRTFYCNNSLSTEELFDAAELRLYK